MGLKEIETEIRKEGKEEIKRTKRETEKTIKEIRGKIEEEANEEYKKEKLQRWKELEMIPKKIISDAKMQKRREINVKRVELLEQVFEKAQENILKLPEKEKKKILKNLIKGGEIKNSVIYLDKKYSPLLKNISNLKAKNIGDFGIIIESQDGSLRINNTLQNVMKRIRTKLEPEIAKILFS